MSVIKVMGKFTAKESQLLSENVSTLLSTHGLDSADICNALNDGERKKIRKNHPFWADLCEQFPRRQYKSIYQAVQRFLVAENTKKLRAEGESMKWDDDNLEKLHVHHAELGSRWAEIGRKMARTGDSCKKAYERKYGEPIENRATGKFSAEEDALIVEQMLKQTGSSSVADTQGKKMMWSNLAKELDKGRSPDDYRRHWQRKIVPNQFKAPAAAASIPTGIGSTGSAVSLVQAVPVNGVAPSNVVATSVSADRDGRREAKSQTRANLLVALHSALIGPIAGIGIPPGNNAHNINFARRNSDAWNSLQADCVDWAAMVYHQGVACARPRVEWDTLFKQAKKKETKTSEIDPSVSAVPLGTLSFIGQIEKLATMHTADIQSLRQAGAQVSPAKLRSPALAFLADNLSGDTVVAVASNSASSSSAPSSSAHSSHNNNPAVLSIPAVVPSSMVPVTAVSAVPADIQRALPIIDYLTDDDGKKRKGASQSGKNTKKSRR